MSTNQTTLANAANSAESAKKAKGLFFLAAGLSFALSIFLYFSGDKQHGIFVGLWVPSILAAGNLILEGRHHE